MKISAIITLKKDVLDPQGKVIQQALDGMGYKNVDEVRQGKQNKAITLTANTNPNRKVINITSEVISK